MGQSRLPLIKRNQEPGQKKYFSHGQLDQVIYKSILFGFPLLTLGVASGAVWANEAWGAYWSWDPKETWSLVTWLAYAILLHARIFFRIKARAAAWGTIACFVLSVLTVLIFPFIFPSLHSAYFQS